MLRAVTCPVSPKKNLMPRWAGHMSTALLNAMNGLPPASAVPSKNSMVHTSRTYLKRLAYAFFCVAITILCTSQSPYAFDIVITLAFLMILIPGLLLLGAQGAFWTYHWIRHGNPFFEAYERPDVIWGTDRRQGGGRRPALHYCTTCKRNTHCTEGRSPGGFNYHIIRP